MLSAFVSTIAVIAAQSAMGAAPVSASSTIEIAPETAVLQAAVRPAAPPVRLAQADTEKPATLSSAATPASNAVAFAGVSDAAVAAEALEYLESLTTLAGGFVQTAPSGQSNAGDFYMRRPGQIRFDYDDPSPITIVATGGMVYVENADLETTDSYPLKKTPLKFLLAKKIDIGDAQLQSVERSADSVALTYASIDAETEGEITLVFAAPKLEIRQWAVSDAQGGVTVVALNGVTEGGKLDNRLFRAPDAGGAFINN